MVKIIVNFYYGSYQNDVDKVLQKIQKIEVDDIFVKHDEIHEVIIFTLVLKVNDYVVKQMVNIVFIDYRNFQALKVRKDIL